MSGAQMDGVQFGELPYLELHGSVHTFAYSADGKVFAVGVAGRGITVSIYDTSSWTKTYSFTAPSSVLVQAMAFSPDGTKVVFGGNDGLVRLWDCASGQEIFIIEGHNLKVNYVTFSPCSKHIASSSDDETVQVWDSQTGESLFVLKGHTSEVWVVKYSPSGERLVSGDRDGTIRLWDSETGEPGVVLKIALGGVTNLAFSPDGRWIASSHEEGELQLWHAESGEQGPVLHGHIGWITGIAFSPDSQWIASSSLDETVRLWGVSTGAPINVLSSHKDWVNDVVFSPSGLQIASGGSDNKVRLWDVDSILSSSVEQQDQLGAVGRTVYSPNGQYILTVSGYQTVKQWDSLTGASRPLSIELPETVSVKSVSYSLDGIPTAAIVQDGSLRLWELQEGGRETVLEGSGRAKHVAMSSCCRWIVSSDQENTLTLWDLDSTQQMHVLIENGGPTNEDIHCLEFSATGHQLAVGTQSGTIWLINPQSKGLITPKSTDRAIEVVSFSPDGQQLTTTSEDGLIYLWGVQSEKRAIELRGHTEEVTCIAYSPCGDWIASGSKDKTVRLWRKQPPGDTESWSCVSTVHGFFHTVLSIAWSPTVPMEFVTGSWDESVRIWRVSSDDKDAVVKLLWGTNLAVLHADGLLLKGTTGLGLTEHKLLVQC
ncbi:U3 small nucleolar RNA-associated protein 13, partial [Linnemannia elongata]